MPQTTSGHTPDPARISEPDPKSVGQTAKRIVIVDDHPLVRAGLSALINAETDLEVCAETDTVRQAQQLVRELNPDLTIIDLSLEDGNGLELIRHLKHQNPAIKILVCSVHPESLFAERVLNAGALGYIDKHQGISDVINAVRRTLTGKIYLSDDAVQRMVQSNVQGANTLASAINHLTDRELQVFMLIGAGASNTQIAERLHLSVKTIETHREKIKRKLQLSNSAELVRHAVQWHLEQG